MIKTYGLTPADVQALRALLLPLDTQLQPDVSNYASGRQRFWLQHQWDLQHRCFLPGVKAPALWQHCQSLCQPLGFVPAIGLVAKGEQRIRRHRDDSYAAFKAVSIQIGPAEWTYDAQYPDYAWVPQAALNPSNPRTYRLTDCLVVFNCKNPHAATPLSADRYSINLWQISRRYQAAFDQYRQDCRPSSD